MDSAVTQSTWRGAILTEGTCTYSVMEGQMFPLNTLSHSHALNCNVSAAEDVFYTKRNVMVPAFV